MCIINIVCVCVWVGVCVCVCVCVTERERGGEGVCVCVLVSVFLYLNKKNLILFQTMLINKSGTPTTDLKQNQHLIAMFGFPLPYLVR